MYPPLVEVADPRLQRGGDPVDNRDWHAQLVRGDGDEVGLAPVGQVDVARLLGHRGGRLAEGAQDREVGLVGRRFSLARHRYEADRRAPVDALEAEGLTRAGADPVDQLARAKRVVRHHPREHMQRPLLVGGSSRHLSSSDHLPSALANARSGLLGRSGVLICPPV